jgi:hypothetical protein
MENKNDENETIRALRVIKIEKLEKKNFGERVNDFKFKSLKKFKEKNFFKRQLIKRLPILGWLPKYNLKTDLMPDLFSGFTVGVMNIAQGMGYALLANADPVNGLYVSFFPLLIYAFLGTSKDVALGNFNYFFLILR